MRVRIPKGSVLRRKGGGARDALWQSSGGGPGCVMAEQRRGPRLRHGRGVAAGGCVMAEQWRGRRTCHGKARGLLGCLILSFVYHCYASLLIPAALGLRGGVSSLDTSEWNCFVSFDMSMAGSCEIGFDLSGNSKADEWTFDVFQSQHSL